MKIELILGDIVLVKAEAIVNAANTTLLGGGGVDGAIHDAAGPELFEACRRLGGCETGDAKITPGFKLQAKYIIHAVGPIWRGGTNNEAHHLASCYRRSLDLAAEHNVTSIVFPSISTGAFSYPPALAAKIAINEVLSFDSGEAALDRCLFCCYSSDDFGIYRRLLQHKSTAFD